MFELDETYLFSSIYQCLTISPLILENKYRFKIIVFSELYKKILANHINPS